MTMNSAPQDAAHQPGGSTVGTLVFILLGPIIWAAHLTLMYAAQSVLCARGLSGPVPLVVAGTTLIGCAALIVVMVAPSGTARMLNAAHWREPQGTFNARLAVLLAALSLFGVCAEGASRARTTSFTLRATS